MLSYELLKNHAGLLLVGDFLSLKELHQVVHDVNERSPLIPAEDGPFLGLAYDARKAYEGQRRKIRPPKGMPELGPRFGVEILWPVLLVQARVLRVSLGYFDHRKVHQAVTYRLEQVIEDGLEAAFAGSAPRIQRAWLQITPEDATLDGALYARGAAYCSWSGDDRRRLLPSLMESFQPAYARAYSSRLAAGESDLVDPGEIAEWAGREWPDPRW